MLILFHKSTKFVSFFKNRNHKYLLFSFFSYQLLNFASEIKNMRYIGIASLNKLKTQGV